MPSTNVAHDIADELAIHRLFAEYCLRFELETIDDWLDLFTPDAVFDVHRRSLNGRQEIKDMLSQAPHGIHIAGACRIKIEGDKAETVQNYSFLGKEEKFSNKGWYHRDLVRTADGWKIAHMNVVMLRPDPTPK
jgi:ketosteroid isomerase-like protein